MKTGVGILSPRRVFVDTGAWIALATKRDINHPAATAFYEKLSQSRARLLTTNYILAETYTRLRYDDGPRKALAFHDVIEMAVTSGRLQVLWVEAEHHQKALDVFRRYPEHVFSFTDCTSFVVAKEAKFSEVFRFVRGFLVMGFVLQP